MWYFAWALGVSLAASFAILNAMWLELDSDRTSRADPPAAGGEMSRP
jgi:cyd operon protein YbgT